MRACWWVASLEMLRIDPVWLVEDTGWWPGAQVVAQDDLTKLEWKRRSFSQR